MIRCRLLLEKVVLSGLDYFYSVFFNRIRQKSLVNGIDRVAGFRILAKKRMNSTSNTKNSKTLIMFDNRKSWLDCRAMYLCKFLLQNLFLMLNNKLISQTKNTELTLRHPTCQSWHTKVFSALAAQRKLSKV